MQGRRAAAPVPSELMWALLLWVTSVAGECTGQCQSIVAGEANESVAACGWMGQDGRGGAIDGLRSIVLRDFECVQDPKMYYGSMV